MKERWLKQTGLDTPDLGHLKRIRKQNDIISLLLSTSAAPPAIPKDIELPNPYTLPVPVSPALTPISLSLKSSLWPTVYAPPRKNEAEDWTRGKCRWAWETMKLTVEAAAKAKSRGEVGFPNPLTVSPLLNSVETAANCCAHPGTVRIEHCE
jgi:tRNA-specific adenosine deaminase 3